MTKLYTIVMALLWAALLYAGSTSWTVGGKSLPAIFSFLSPHEGFWQNAEGKLKDEELFCPKINSKVKIVFDERQVPHIYADNISDAIYAQGILHAQNRLFQNDLSSRSTRGTLAEVLGEDLVKVDHRALKLGLPETIAKTAEAWKKHEDSFALLKSYCSGYNSIADNLQGKEIPLEYKLIGASPRSWEIEDIIAIIKSMQLVLAFRADDLNLSNSRNFLGDSLFQKYHPAWNPKQIPIIPDQSEWSDWKLEETEFSPAIGSWEPRDVQEQEEGVGSNNWVVGPSKSKTGKPILCNDPHLKLTLPSVWYEIHIHTPEINSYGVSLPGVPGIIIGFNEDIAWGMTNVGQDVTDWYSIDWVDTDKTKYLLDGKEIESKSITYDIAVKGQENQELVVKQSQWGPIYEEQNGDQDLALQWIGT